jgi:hypothetical protein
MSPWLNSSSLWLERRCLRCSTSGVIADLLRCRAAGPLSHIVRRLSAMFIRVYPESFFNHPQRPTTSVVNPGEPRMTVKTLASSRPMTFLKRRTCRTTITGVALSNRAQHRVGQEADHRDTRDGSVSRRKPLSCRRHINQSAPQDTRHSARVFPDTGARLRPYNDFFLPKGIVADACARVRAGPEGW